MKRITVKAPAKLNLTLDVLGKRPDGYHEMKMLMQTVSLCDEVTLTLTEGEGDQIDLSSDLSFLPTDGKNLAYSAAERLRESTGVHWERLTIQIRKRIPVCAGTAGGSADAAAVLRGLDQLCGLGLPDTRLMEIGGEVGSDVPYCVVGGTALCTGRGELVEPLPALPHCWIVMAKPDFPISTPELFGRIDLRRLRCHPNTAEAMDALRAGDLSALARRMFNVFEEVLDPREGHQIEELKRCLLEHGALGATMSGTGPTVFGLFEAVPGAEKALCAVKGLCRDAFLVEPV